MKWNFVWSTMAFLISTFTTAKAETANDSDCGSKDGKILPCWTNYLASNEAEESLPYYPYAKRPNGCSVPPFRPGAVDVFVAGGLQFDFSGACRIHDRCYYTYGSVAAECNDIYGVNLRAACDAGVPVDDEFLKSKTVFEYEVSAELADLSPKDKCLRRANVFLISVNSTSSRFHANAQATALDYISRVNDYVNSH